MQRMRTIGSWPFHPIPQWVTDCRPTLPKHECVRSHGVSPYPRKKSGLKEEVQPPRPPLTPSQCVTAHPTEPVTQSRGHPSPTHTFPQFGPSPITLSLGGSTGVPPAVTEPRSATSRPPTSYAGEFRGSPPSPPGSLPRLGVSRPGPRVARRPQCPHLVRSRSRASSPRR